MKEARYGREKRDYMLFMSQDRTPGRVASLPEGRAGTLGMHPMSAHVDSRWLIEKRRREVKL